MVQEAESVQVAALPAPSWSLQLALVSQTAIEPEPSLKSQVELSVQVTALRSPPAPLHSDESLQVTVSSPDELPLHLADSLHSSEHASSPHSALQSAPASQVQADSTQTQPAPVQVGSPPSLPQPAAPIDSRNPSDTTILALMVRPPTLDWTAILGRTAGRRNRDPLRGQ
jgi:hypothetical protein